MKIKVECPTCGDKFSVDSGIKTARCGCGHKFPVSYGKDIAETVK